jgi:hypothetical protein
MFIHSAVVWDEAIELCPDMDARDEGHLHMSASSDWSSDTAQ